MKRATFLVLAMVLLVSVAYADGAWKSKPSSPRPYALAHLDSRGK